MQVNLDKTDRRLLVWTGVLLLPVLVGLAFLSQNEEKDSGIPSTWSAQASGGKAAYLFLKEEGYKVERWERPPAELPIKASNTVLVVAGPIRVASKEEKNALQMYLDRGGRILGTGYSAASFLPHSNAIPEPLPGAVWKEYQPEIMSPLTRAGAIRMSPRARWGDALPTEQVHYTHEGKGIVVSYKAGRGEVIWWAADTPLTNAGIKEAGNLDLLLNSLGGSKNTQVYWDEYFHSYGNFGHESYWKLPAVRFGLVQCGLAFLALLLTYSRRNAPIREMKEPSRLSPVEFVQTLGGLYRKANATRTALEVPYNRFRTMLAKRLGVRANTATADLVRGARNRLAYEDADLEATLTQIENSFYDPEMTEARILDLVQKLNRHAHNLKLISQEEQEKTPHANRLPGADPRTN